MVLTDAVVSGSDFDLSQIKVTPLSGGQNGESGVCSLLEIGSFRILLDCGCATSSTNESILEIAEKLRHLSSAASNSDDTAASTKPGFIDCVLLSHSDIHHMGALPIVFGNMGLPPVPIYCSTPIAKQGMMMLYDFQLNIQMEGIDPDDDTEDAENSNDNTMTTNPDDKGVDRDGDDNNNAIDPSTATAVIKRRKARFPTFNLDDIDRSMQHIQPVKFHQPITLTHKIINTAGSSGSVSSQITLTAVNSGRTLGGSVWKIHYNATDVVYMIDINLKNEIVCDGCNIDAIPLNPALVITEGHAFDRKDAEKEGKKETGGGRKRKKFTDANDGEGGTTSGGKDSEVSVLVESILETLRKRGNVLIPCDSAARVHELFQVLGRHWIDSKNGLDHLVFLTPMAFNILEYSRSQLEYMNDSLSKQFFNGKTNPFELPPLKIASSIRELERGFTGPKCVIATDSSLSCGLGKELLLRWGGNPLNRVIFTDDSESASFAYELRSKASRGGPIVVTVPRPQRVELEGLELQEYQREVDSKRRLQEESLQRKKRQEELALLTAERRDMGGEDDEESEEEEEEEEEAGDSKKANGAAADVDKASKDGMDVEEETPASTATTSAKGEKKKERKVKISSSRHIHTLNKFAEPLFRMFETADGSAWKADPEYGVSLDDLDLSFEDGTSSATRASLDLHKKGLGEDEKNGGISEALLDLESRPWKTVSTMMKTQFTCEFKHCPLSGRADSRAIRTLLSKLQPLRVVLLRGSRDSSEKLMNVIGTTVNSQSNGGIVTAPPSTSSDPKEGEGKKTEEVNLLSIQNENQSITALADGETYSFGVEVDRVQLHIPNPLFPQVRRELRNTLAAARSGDSSIEHRILVSKIGGTFDALPHSVLQENNRDKAGVKMARLVEPPSAEELEAEKKEEEEMAALEALVESGQLLETLGEGEEEAEEGNEEEVDELGLSASFKDSDGPTSFLEVGEECKDETNIVLSAGEVSLNELKVALEKEGQMHVELQTISSHDGSILTLLLCDSQVIIRKNPKIHRYSSTANKHGRSSTHEGMNDFLIEGPPVAAYWKAREILYSKFAFL